MVRMAVISDIHAFEPAAGATDRTGDPSWVRTTDGPEARRAPFSIARTADRDEELAADYLICCGDMGDKADAAGIAHAWGWLETLRRRLDAQLTLATTGNHDVDSYDVSRRHDPRVFIRSLQPPYPVDRAALVDEYWQRHVIHVAEQTSTSSYLTRALSTRLVSRRSVGVSPTRLSTTSERRSHDAKPIREY